MRLAVGLSAFISFGVAGSAVAPLDFRFERPVMPGGRGGNRLSVDVGLLSGGAPLRYEVGPGGRSFEGGLEDLRFFDASWREVGYLLIAPASATPVWQAGRILPIEATKTQSSFEVDLGAVRQVDRLSVEGLPPPYLKRVRLEGGGDRTRWTLLVAEGTLFDLPEEKLRRTDFEFSAGDFRYFRVVWDDRSSGRVPTPRRVAARLAAPTIVPPPERIAAVFERRPSEPGKSRFRVHLPGAHLPVIALEFSVASGHVLRPVEVSEPRLAGGEVAPAPIGSGTLRRAERGDLVASDLSVAIASPEGPDLDVLVEDGNNPPLALTAVQPRLAPLPWIYFESADGATLTARFGAAGAKRPSYDLEAVRDSVAKASLTGARWGALHSAAHAVAAQAAPFSQPGAPVDASKFRHARHMPPAAPGLNALQLDVAVLAGSTLSDLRLSDGDGRQVPYLFEKQDEPLAWKLPAPARKPPDPARPGRSVYRVRLPYATFPACRLSLSTSARVFERHVSLWIDRSMAGGNQEAPVEASEADWRHAEPETPAPALVLTVPSRSGTDLTLLVDEGDNAPLPLDPPTLLLPSYRLRFFGVPGQSLTLLYGQEDLPAPRYDLALLATRLVGAAAHDLALSAEAASQPAVPGASRTLVFWGGLIIAVGAFLALIVRLMRKQSLQS